MPRANGSEAGQSRGREGETCANPGSGEGRAGEGEVANEGGYCGRGLLGGYKEARSGRG